MFKSSMAFLNRACYNSNVVQCTSNKNKRSCRTWIQSTCCPAKNAVSISEIPMASQRYTTHIVLCTADFSTAPAAQRTKRSGYVRIGSSRRTAAIQTKKSHRGFFPKTDWDRILGDFRFIGSAAVPVRSCCLQKTFLRFSVPSSAPASSLVLSDSSDILLFSFQKLNIFDAQFFLPSEVFFSPASSKAALAALCNAMLSRFASKNRLLYPAFR